MNMPVGETILNEEEKNPMKICVSRPLYWAAAMALAVTLVSGGVRAGETRRKAQALQIGADAMLTSIAAQRTFSGVLPSAADYAGKQAFPEASGPSCAPAGWEVWASPFGRVAEHDGEGIFNGYEFDQFGGSVGLTRSFGNAFLGVSVGYDHRKTKMGDFASIKNLSGTGENLEDASVKGDALHTALYGGATFGSFFVDAYAGFSRSWNDTTLAAWDNRYDGKYADNVYSAGLKIGNVWNLSCDARLLASIGLDYSHVKTPEYDIHYSTGFDDVRSSSFNSAELPIMLGLDKTFSSGGVSWTPEIRAGWIPRFGARSSSFACADSTAPNDVYYARSTRQPTSYGVVGTGLTVRASDKVRVGLDYDFRFARRETSHTFSASLGIGF